MHHYNMKVIRWRKKTFMFMATISVSLLVFLAIKVVKIIMVSKYGKRIPVFIVEEHHEALPYWVDVANEGIIAKTGNTLIHIDGHSDDGLPRYLMEFPFFKWPYSDYETWLIMQQNDIFILGGVIIGLIDRFIWIVPEWNKETKNVTHDITEMELGWTRVNIDGDEQIKFCKCIVDEDNENSSKQPFKEKKKCVFMNETIEPPGDPEVLLKPASLCNIKTTFIFEVLPLHVAVSLAEKNNDWIDKDESIILDIDEDYFGCEIPGRMLYDVGMNWSSLQFLNSHLEQLFCPKYIEHENSGSEVMTKILHTIAEKCDYKITKVKEKQIKNLESCKSGIVDVINHIFPTVLESWKIDPLLYCSMDSVDLRKRTRDVVVAFYNLSPVKLQKLLKIGFCLNTSPQTLWFGDDGHLVICHGNNDPDRPMVQVYIPETNQILSDRLNSVDEFLDVLPISKTVTVCRSIRDGYTPRTIQRQVEKHLINYFQLQKKITSQTDLHYEDIYQLIYDDNLLNGTHGLS